MTVVILVLHVAGSVGMTIGICAVLLFCAWRIFCTLQQGTNYVRRLHQIPCSQCAYFTGDYRLKCTVNPFSALTEEAIGCVDYASNSVKGNSSNCQTNLPIRQIKELVKH